MSDAPAWVVRAARAADLNPLLDLAQALGPGMTTLPPDAAVLAHKIACSERTFAGQETDDRQHVLVLEDLADGRVLGIAAVYPRIGERHGFFSYKLTKLVQRSDLLGRRVDVELLTLSNDYTGATEVGSLAIRPELRGTSAGRLLARSRYMLIAAFPQLFADRVMAEMRGWQDADGRSPFWDAIGARFFDLPFEEADRLSAVEGAGFIADLMPKQPIYTALLPEAARQAIGRAHAVSAKAMAMLMDEDFRYEAHIDVFDGGPQVHAGRDKIRTVQENRLAEVSQTPAQDATPWLVSNTRLEDFRVVETRLSVSDGQAAIGEAVRRALSVVGGGEVRVAPSRERRPRA
ncbi:arginine N-succinyltransferase [Caulobacter segnis]